MLGTAVPLVRCACMHIPAASRLTILGRSRNFLASEPCSMTFCRSRICVREDDESCTGVTAMLTRMLAFHLTLELLRLTLGVGGGDAATALGGPRFEMTGWYTCLAPLRYASKSKTNFSC